MNFRVLFVEDDAILLDLYKEVIQDIADVIVASSYEEAVCRLNDEPVDMVFADFRLEDRTGLDLLAWIKQHKPALDKAFVLVSGLPPDGEIGCRVMSKPLPMDALSDCVATYKAQAAGMP